MVSLLVIQISQALVIMQGPEIGSTILEDKGLHGLGQDKTAPGHSSCLSGGGEE